MLTRRNFLAAAGALVGATACRASLLGAAQSASGAGTAPGRRIDRVGIQLYTVRSEMRRDMDGTLRQLAAIGYREVEFAGYFGRGPAETKALLERHGLSAPSTHIGFDLIATGWNQALDDAIARGHRFVTVPWLPVEVRRSVDTWRAVADAFNRAGAAARERGLRFAYHNHDFEFARVGGERPFDLLLRHTDPELVSFQMDVFWLVKGGGDPLSYLRAHPSRFSMLHVKDSSGPPAHSQVNVGAGTIDFASILRLDASQRGAIQHLFVEHDQPADPVAFAKASFDYLRTVSY